MIDYVFKSKIYSVYVWIYDTLYINYAIFLFFSITALNWLGG